MSQQSQSGSVSIPSDMKAFNTKLIEEFRAKGGKLSGRLANSQLLLLTTRGARTAESRTVVMGYRAHGDAYVVIASNNAADSHPAWYFNLLANPVATAEVGAEKFEVKARTARPDERAGLARLVDYFGPQQAKTQREIPIVVLERI